MQVHDHDLTVLHELLAATDLALVGDGESLLPP